MIKPLRIAITTGDIDGIGLEVTAKALAKIRPQRGVQFYLWRSPGASPKYLRLIDKYFRRTTVKDWPSALQLSTDYYKNIVDIESPMPPAKWVELMAYSGMSKSITPRMTAATGHLLPPPPPIPAPTIGPCPWMYLPNAWYG